MKKPVVVGFSGGSGSGKTTIIKMLARAFIDQGTSVLVLSQDHYYKDLSHMSMDERHEQNFDHPDALDSELMIEHIKKLSQGEDISRPTYDFATHARLPQNEKLAPEELILFDGIFTLHFEAIRSCLNLSYFVDVASDLRLGRRIKRDVRSRGRTVDTVIDQYVKTVRPMHQNFIEPSKQFAHRLLDWQYRDLELVESVKKEIELRLS